MSKIPMYRYGTKEEVTSRDLTNRIAKVMSDILSVRYDRKVTIKFEGDDDDETQAAATSDTQSS